MKYWYLAFYTAAFASTAHAACEPARPIACAKSVTAEMLDRESTALDGKKFSVAEPSRVSVIDKADAEEYFAELEEGVEYAFVAACGDKCSEAKLTLLDEKQQVLVASDDKSPVVILNGKVPAKGFYSLTVAAPGCGQEFCGVGLLVMRK